MLLSGSEAIPGRRYTILTAAWPDVDEVDETIGSQTQEDERS